MILNGNSRGSGQELALHLMNAQDNEQIELHDIRGFISQDLSGALLEAEAIAKGTKCDEYLYSLSLNPPKDENVSVRDFKKAIKQVEKKLGLTNQPRAIVFHIKDGRKHAHAVWSRIDGSKMKAIQLSYDRMKLTDLSRQIFLEHGWEMPAGLRKRGERDVLNYSYALAQQAKKHGKDAREIKRQIMQAWASSDDKKSLINALEDKGYFLARGDRRNFVVIDGNGEIYSLPKMANVKTKEVLLRIGEGEDLPSLDETREKVLEFKQEKQIEQNLEIKFSKPEQALKHIENYHSAFTKKMIWLAPQ